MHPQIDRQTDRQQYAYRHKCLYTECSRHAGCKCCPCSYTVLFTENQAYCRHVAMDGHKWVHYMCLEALLRPKSVRNNYHHVTTITSALTLKASQKQHYQGCSNI